MSPSAAEGEPNGASDGGAEAAPLRRVYRWDLDKTYLRSEFATFSDLVKSAFEGAEKKQSVPGAAALLRELKKGGGVRVSFISGSPQQMRKVLTRKLELDGVAVDEFILKPNLRNLVRGRFRALREQVGYKLPALLSGRAGLPPSVHETCFGDDSEADALVYSLYGDLRAGRADRALLSRVLEAARVYPDDAARTLALYDAADKGECVDRILIHLDLRSPTSRFDRYGARLVPFYNYFQAGLVLLEDGVLDAAAVLGVALDMIEHAGYTLDALCNSMEDLLRRGRMRRATPLRLAQRIGAGMDDLLQSPGSSVGRALLDAFAARLTSIASAPGGFLAALPPDAPIDYLAAFAEVDPHR